MGHPSKPLGFHTAGDLLWPGFATDNGTPAQTRHGSLGCANMATRPFHRNVGAIWAPGVPELGRCLDTSVSNQPDADESVRRKTPHGGARLSNSVLLHVLLCPMSPSFCWQKIVKTTFF